jgi:hypothetical protein
MALKDRWYIPKTGWDYFIMLGVLINMIVALILIVAYIVNNS